VRSSRELRGRLRESHLALLFTPALCEGEALEVLEAALPHVDLVQVRIEHPDGPGHAKPARELFEWCERVLDLVGGADVLVTVDDRADVALALAPRGLAGVHVGADDLPPEDVRRLLGPDPLIGLSTHAPREVADAGERPVDYVGFGPIHATATKGYTRGLGAEAAWVSAAATELPLFPIGGIDATNASELTQVGRAAVSSGILRADDPSAAAAAIRAQLLG
jgi:thiamine-phosphate pyrophosphorylase